MKQKWRHKEQQQILIDTRDGQQKSIKHIKQQEQEICIKRKHTQAQEEQKLKKNDREKTKQTGIKDERTCYTCGTRGHKRLRK